MEQLFDELSDYYHGFMLTEPVGNNAFSYEQRQCREIMVPPLIKGDLNDVCAGVADAFCEVVDGQEKRSLGLDRFVYWPHDDKHVFIVDNHNHAFSCWGYGLKAGLFEPGRTLVHVDQHKDARQPAEYLEECFWEMKSIAEICDYANITLNVGNFIDPALRSGIFSRVSMVDHEAAFEKPVKPPFVLDIDLDVFSCEMDYIDNNKKIVFIRGLIQQASFVTVATSPHFIDQSQALDVLKQLF